MSSSVRIGNRKKNILIFGEGPTQELDDTTLTAESKYPINFTQLRKRLALSLNYKGSFLFANAAKVYKLKAKYSEIKDYVLCLGDIFKDFTINNMRKVGLKEIVKIFAVNFNPIDSNDILDIHSYFLTRK